MRINCVVASGYQLDPAIDVNVLKNIGPVWGSWKTWRSCATDNVICHDTAKGVDLIKRNFQKNCNFYVPESSIQMLGRPSGVQVYGGKFLQEVDNIEDIVSLHLASAQSDIVIMLGFDLSTAADSPDQFETHKRKNYLGLVRSLIVGQSEIQWVLADYSAEPDKTYLALANLTCDTFENVLQFVAQ
jgi:hypothetical protein